VPRADIVFTTETQSTLGSEYFLSRTHLLRDLGDSAVSSLLGSVPGKCCLKLRLNIEINKKRSRRSERTLGINGLLVAGLLVEFATYVFLPRSIALL
jgi:hypothetical protein